MRRTLLADPRASFLPSSPTAPPQEPRIAAGVSAAAGTDVSGLTLRRGRGQARYLANTLHIGSPLSTHVAGRKFLISPKDVGFKFDAAKTARRAYNAGAAAAHRRRSTCRCT